MALNTLEQNTINRGIAAARKVITELDPVLRDLNVVYDRETVGVKATVEQADLDAAAYLSGLTKAELDDGMFALTSTLRTAVANAYTALSILASRGS